MQVVGFDGPGKPSKRDMRFATVKGTAVLQTSDGRLVLVGTKHPLRGPSGRASPLKRP